MNIKDIFSVVLVSLFMSGCCVPAPSDYRVSNAVIDSDLIDSIVSDKAIPVNERSIPDEILDLEFYGKAGSVDIIRFKDDLCSCSKRRFSLLSVSSVNQKGLNGYVRRPKIYFPPRRNNNENENECGVFQEAEKALKGAINSSQNAEYFYLDAFNLIWEAGIALEPLECDPVKAKVLANKAQLLTNTVGVKLLSNDNKALQKDGVDRRYNKDKHFQEFGSQRAAIDIDYEVIDEIRYCTSSKHVDSL